MLLSLYAPAVYIRRAPSKFNASKLADFLVLCAVTHHANSCGAGHTGLRKCRFKQVSQHRFPWVVACAWKQENLQKYKTITYWLNRCIYIYTYTCVCVWIYINTHRMIQKHDLQQPYLLHPTASGCRPRESSPSEALEQQPPAAFLAPVGRPPDAASACSEVNGMVKSPTGPVSEGMNLHLPEPTSYFGASQG